MWSRAGLSRAGLLSLALLLMTYCEVGQCSCQRGFSKCKVEAVIAPQVSKGQSVFTVQFLDCGLGRNIQLRTNDDGFEVLPGGSLRATRPQTIDSKYEFKVLAEDLETRETWAVEVQLIPSKKTTLVKRSLQVIRFPARSISRRQKREWIIPPVDVREHEPPMNNPIAVIRSDAEDLPGVHITYVVTGPGVNEPPYGLFVINKHTGELNITGEVDREITSAFILTGQAYDQNQQTRESPIELLIKVLDINDNAPIFKVNVFEGSVEELSAFGTFAMKLNATDADEGENAIIKYRIISEHVKEQFTATMNGEIKVTNPHLDRETQDFYTFLVEARDKSGDIQGLVATATAQIKILDVNDNIPVIEQLEYVATVTENSKNIEVVRIKVLDKDLEFTDNWLAHFDIIEGNEGKHFRMEVDKRTNEGILIIQKGLNYEEMELVNLMLRVSNKAPYHSSVPDIKIVKPIKIKLHVKDVTEGYRFKTSSWLVSINESITHKPVRQVLGTYLAVSADSGKPNKMTKYAKNYDIANWLVINSETGEVTFVGVPDRESPYVINGTYTATVLAINNENSPASTCTGTIVLKVDDCNDHLPNFENLRPCMCSNTKSLTLAASDPDGEPYGAPFRFKIHPNAKWRIGRTDATSMELVPLQDLWPGIFTVPVLIEDNDGNGHTVNLDVKVAECRDTSMCSSEKLSQSTNAALGAAAIVLMVLALLLLLLVPLLLLFCQCGGGGGGVGPTKGLFVMPDSSKGVLAQSNIEGGGQVDTIQPLIPSEGLLGTKPWGEMARPVAGSGIGGSTGSAISRINKTGAAIQENKLWEEGAHGDSQTGSKQLIWINKGDVRYIDHGNWRNIHGTSSANRHNVHGRSLGNGNWSRSWSSGRMMEGSCKAYMEQYINELLASAAESAPPDQRDCLLVYSNEGENSPTGSLGSCSLIEGIVEDDTFLNDLGPKFRTLAEICRGQSESQSLAISTSKTWESTTSTGPLIQPNYMVKEESVSSDAVKLQRMAVNPPPAQKHIVVTTTINPIGEELQVMPDPMFVQRSATANIKSGVEEWQDMSFITDPALAQTKTTTTKFDYGAGGLPGTILSFTPIPVVQNSVVVTRSVSSGTGEMQGVIAGPPVGQMPLIRKNVEVTRSFTSGTGEMQDVIAGPPVGQMPLIRKNVEVTRSFTSGAGEMQGVIAGPPVGQMPLVQKNVVVTRSVNSGTGGMQGFHIATKPAIEENLGSSKSGGGAYRSVKKVTQTVQLVQE